MVICENNHHHALIEAFPPQSSFQKNPWTAGTARAIELNATPARVMDTPPVQNDFAEPADDLRSSPPLDMMKPLDYYTTQ